jgi:gliding motility-associated-like protein
VSILDPYVQFTNASTGAPIAIFNWSLGDPDSTKSNVANPSIMYPAIGTYTVVLIVTTSYGCADSTTKYIKVEDEFVMYVPNAFSPNNDGVNDMFFAKGDGFKDFKMTIFDRWGTQVFTTNDIAKGWDGHFHSNPVMEDVYVWKIECKTTKGESKMLKGHVSIIK